MAGGWEPATSNEATSNLLYFPMIQHHHHSNNPSSKRINQHDPRHDVLQFSDDGIVLWFYFIEEVFDECIEHFGSEDQEDGNDDECGLEEAEIQEDGEEQCENCTPQVQTKIRFFLPHETDPADGVTKTTEETAGHGRSIEVCACPV